MFKDFSKAVSSNNNFIINGMDVLQKTVNDRLYNPAFAAYEAALPVKHTNKKKKENYYNVKSEAVNDLETNEVRSNFQNLS